MRKLLKHPAVKAVLVIGAIHLASALSLDRILVYKEAGYRSERVPPSLDGYTIAFLTDIHGYPQKKLEEMAARINERGVDLVLLGGDVSGHRGSDRSDLAECMGVLAGIDAADGFFGVRGNHDLGPGLKAAMEKQGMTLLENKGETIRPGLFVAGLEDLWTGSPDVEKALEGSGRDDLVLMLCHNPDSSMELDFSGVDLALSGHNHGGEITFFGLWAPAMVHVSRYGQRFVSGWCRSAAGTDVYVGKGIGAQTIRCFSRPEVIFMTLYAK